MLFWESPIRIVHLLEPDFMKEYVRILAQKATNMCGFH